MTFGVFQARAMRARLMTGAALRTALVAPIAAASGVALTASAHAAAVTVSPVQTTTYQLSPSANPVTFGAGTNIDTTGTPPASAVTGDASTNWTITNQGTLKGGFNGVILNAPGVVNNNGSISGNVLYGVQAKQGATINNAVGATIHAEGVGIVDGTYGAAGNQPGVVTNAGTIFGVQIAGIETLGDVVNSSTGVISAVNGGDTFGVIEFGGTVTNAGLITANEAGVELFRGGLVNQAGGVIGGGYAVEVQNLAGLTITNAGSIGGDPNHTTFSGVKFIAGGTVVNQNGGAITGLSFGIVSGGPSWPSSLSVTNQAGATISGQNGVASFVVPATLDNAGHITGSAGDGVMFAGGGSVTNQSGGIIQGVTSAVTISGGAGTVTNSGALSASGGVGVLVTGGGSVTNTVGGVITGTAKGVSVSGGASTVDNAGAISATAASGVGVDAGAGVVVTNETGGQIDGATGVRGADVINGGTINGVTPGSNGASGTGVLLTSGALVNQAGGAIMGGGDGVLASGSATVTNAGSIVGVHVDGVDLSAGGNVVNQGGADISGARYGVVTRGASDHVTNAGTISGATASVAFTGSGDNVLTLQNGAVLNGAALGSTAVGATNSLVLTGAGETDNDFAHFGSLTVHADGGWALGGTSTIGVTEVSSGTLIVTGTVTSAFTVDSGATLRGSVANLQAQGTIVDNGAVQFDQHDDATFSGVLSGSGALVKQNSGVLTLTGDFSVGSTNVTAGTLIVSGALTSNFNVSEGATLKGSSSALLAQGALTDEGTVVFDQASDGVFSVGIGGSGKVLKTNTGSLTLSGNSSVGSTEVAEGALNVTGALASAITVDSGATLSANGSNLSGSIVDNGTAIFNPATASSFGGVISGSGQLIKQNTGAMTLAGTSSVGATEVDGGSLIVTGRLASAFTVDSGATLQGTSASLAGAVSDNGTLIFDQTMNGAFDDTITGSGLLAKQGSGLLALNGVSSIAATNVSGGNLQIGDAAHPTAQLTSTVTVGPGATLSGHGMVVGNVTNAGGIVAPGGSIGVLTVNGDYTQTSAGTLSFEITSHSNSSLVVTGAANLAGTLQLAADAGVYRKGQTYHLINAAHFTGAFTTLTASNGLTYDLTSVAGVLTATLETGNFGISGGAANQHAIAVGFVNYPVGVSDFDPVADALIALPAGSQQNAALDTLGGEIDADTIAVGRDDTRSVLDTIGDRLADAPGAAVSDAKGTGVWGSLYGRFDSLKSDANAYGLHRNTFGVIGGMQHDLGADTTLGAVIGYGHTSLSLNGLAQSGTFETVSGAAYGEQRFGAFFIDGAGLLGHDHGDSTRTISFTAVNRRASAAFNGYVVAGKLTAGGRWGDARSLLIEPSVSIDYTRVKQDAFTETGAGGADLAVAEQTQGATEGTVGARLSKSISVAGGNLKVDGRLAWAHEFTDAAPRIHESFAAAAGSDFTLSGADTGRNAALVGAGFAYETHTRVTFFGRYQASVGNRHTDHYLSLGGAWSW